MNTYTDRNQFSDDAFIDERNSYEINDYNEGINLNSENDIYDEHEDVDYLGAQNNSNIGYNEELLANELYQAQKAQEYSLTNNSYEDESEDYSEEINESEKYAVD